MFPTENAVSGENGGGGNRTHETIPTDKKPWPRGRCEFWTSDRSMCGKKGRWMVGNEIRCGEHA